MRTNKRGFNNRKGTPGKLSLWVLVFTLFVDLVVLRVWAQPPPPTGLSVIQPYDGQVNLQWTPNPTASPTAYNLYRYLVDLTNIPTPNPTGTSTPIANLPATMPGYQDFQVTNGRNYLYFVSGIDAAGGEGPLSNPVTAGPFANPAAVQPVTVQNIHSNALDLFWGVPVSSYPISIYQIYRYAKLTPTPLFIFTSTPTFTGTLTPSPTPTSLPANTVPAATVLAAATPIGVTAGTNYTDASAVSLLTDGIYYVVLAVDSQPTPSIGLAPTVSTNEALPRNLMPPAPPLLTASMGLTIVPVIGTNGYGVRLIWANSLPTEGVTAYQVLRNSVPITTLSYVTGSAPVIYDDPTIPESGSAALLTNYTVAAINGNGSTNSNTVQVSLVEPGISNPITVVPDATANAVTISWNPGTNGTYPLSGYWVFKGTNGVPPANPTPNPLATATPSPFAKVVFTPSAAFTLTPIVDSPIVNHTSYWVVPFDVTNNGGAVGAAATPSLNLAPTPVGNVTASLVAGTNNGIAVSWTNGGTGFYGPVQEFVVYRENYAAQTLTPTAVATVPGAQSSFNDFVPGSGTSVVYQVGAVDSQGNTSDISSLSNLITLSALVVPGIPQGLPVSSNAATLQFSWKANPASDGVNSYSVFGPDFQTLTATTTLTPTPIAIVPAIPTATVYTFSAPATPWTASSCYVAAQNPVSFSTPAALFGIIVPTYQVTAVITPATHQVSVSWNMLPVVVSTPIDAYGVYRSLTPGANFTPIASVTVTSPSYTDSSALAGNTYYYRVTARTDLSASQLAESPLYPAVAPPPEGNVQTWPNSPGAFTAVSGVTTNIIWPANTPLENVISYAITQVQNGIAVTSVNVAATSVITPSPTYPVYSIGFVETVPGGISSYEIAAKNAQGYSDSVTLNVLVQPSMTPTFGVTPPAGVNPTPGVTPAFPQAVWVSGLAYSNAVSGYTLYRLNPSVTPSPTQSFNQLYSQVASAAVSTPVITDPGAVPGYVNYYKVVADNGAGVTQDPNAVPAQAVSVWPNIPLMSLNANATTVILSWATPVGNTSVTSYTVYRSIYPSITPTVIANLLAPASIYSDSPVTAGFGYYYWLDAQGTGGTSAFPAPQAIIPLNPPTISITPLLEKNIVTWLPVTVPNPNIVTGYVVYRAQPTPGMTPTFSSISPVLQGLSNTTYADTTVGDTGTYLYKVVVANLSNPSIHSDFSNLLTQTISPQPVSSLIAVSGDGLVQLRWNNQGVTTATYTLQRKLGSAPDTSYQIIKTGLQGVNYLDTGVQDKTFYAYRLVTVDVPLLGVTYVSTPSVPAIALPAKPPVVLNSGVNLAQNSDSAQTLIGNTLTWMGADQPFTDSAGNFFQTGVDPNTMYPLGGYSVFSSTDGGGVYQLVTQLPVTFNNRIPSSPITYFDQIPLVGTSAHTYLIQAFDSPPDLPMPLSQAATQGLVHTTSYQPVAAFPVGHNTALDRNAIRPFSTLSNEQKVNIRFVVTSQGNVNIKVYTLNGTFVKELINGPFAPGIHWTSWDAHNMNGTLVASGVYLISTESPDGHQEFQKVAVIK